MVSYLDLTIFSAYFYAVKVLFWIVCKSAKLPFIMQFRIASLSREMQQGAPQINLYKCGG